MQLPNGFKSSEFARRIQYDDEGRMYEQDMALPNQATGIGDANSLYATDAERFDSISPFLAANRARDAMRRNYIIAPGGDRVFPDVDESQQPEALPSQRTSFGHDSLDGTKMVTGGRAFTLGQQAGRQVPGRAR